MRNLIFVLSLFLAAPAWAQRQGAAAGPAAVIPALGGTGTNTTLVTPRVSGTMLLGKHTYGTATASTQITFDSLLQLNRYANYTGGKFEDPAGDIGSYDTVGPGVTSLETPYYGTIINNSNHGGQAIGIFSQALFGPSAKAGSNWGAAFEMGDPRVMTTTQWQSGEEVDYFTNNTSDPGNYGSIIVAISGRFNGTGASNVGNGLFIWNSDQPNASMNTAIKIKTRATTGIDMSDAALTSHNAIKLPAAAMITGPAGGEVFNASGIPGSVWAAGTAPNAGDYAISVDTANDVTIPHTLTAKNGVFSGSVISRNIGHAESPFTGGYFGFQPPGGNVPIIAYSGKQEVFRTDTAGNIDFRSHILSTTGPAPAVSACGTGAPTINPGSSDFSGSVTEGARASTCTITFAAAYVNGHCVISSPNGAMPLSYTDPVATKLVITNAAATGDKFVWKCN